MEIFLAWDKQCPMPLGILVTMKANSSKRTASKMIAPVELCWTHCGTQYRVTAWPEVAFERETTEGWVSANPDEDVRASAAVSINAATWRRYLADLPAAERAYLNRFRYGRLDALRVISQCPSLFEVLQATPGLSAFIGCHVSLRGCNSPRWSEINAIHERSGLFGLLEWLGLPAVHSTLDALDNILDPDIPRRLLEPLRAALWQPAAIHVFQQAPVLSDRQLARCVNALAA